MLKSIAIVLTVLICICTTSCSHDPLAGEWQAKRTYNNSGRGDGWENVTDTEGTFNFQPDGFRWAWSYGYRGAWLSNKDKSVQGRYIVDHIQGDDKLNRIALYKDSTSPPEVHAIYKIEGNVLTLCYSTTEIPSNFDLGPANTLVEFVRK